MNLGSFFKLVEIQTKVASVIPFLLGTLYAVYRFNSFNTKNFLLMLVSLLAIDMATTAINNFYDYKKAEKTHGYGYETHNAIVRDKLKESTVLGVIFMLLGTAAIFGFILFLNTNIIVLILGGISFMVGVTYSFGPVPISRTPFGELFSGGFMGLIIVFISIYIHIFDQSVLSLSFEKGRMLLDMNIVELIYIAMVSLLTVGGIANIMLANNICDMGDDLENKRYTLPIFIGKEKALKLFSFLYYIGYGALLILLALRIEPIISAIVFLTLIPLNKNLRIFNEKQLKSETFVLAVKNFILINVTHILAIGMSIIIRSFT